MTRSAKKTSTAASAPSGCCPSSTRTNYPYLHLADGALADNLGARAILDEVALGETVTDALRRNGFSRARRMLFIVVDARTGFDRALRAASRAARHQESHGRGGQRTFNRYSFETMNLMRARVKRWENEVRTHAL